MDSSEDGAMARAGTDFEKILQEAKSRWLRPVEIFDILNNYNHFRICNEPPNLPPSGTLILFDRRMLRNFRRDGHIWKKKKDNKTVKEAHEHLKVGSEEKIHVYYAHGDGGSNLQRRVYWLLDKTLEHIVLVHYLEVKETSRTNMQQPWQQNATQGLSEQQSVYRPSSVSAGADVTAQQSVYRPFHISPSGTVLSSESSAERVGTHQMELSNSAQDDEDFDKFDLGELELIDSAVSTQWFLPQVVGQPKDVQVSDESFASMPGLGYGQVNQTHSGRSGMELTPVGSIMKQEVYFEPGNVNYDMTGINNPTWEGKTQSLNNIDWTGVPTNDGQGTAISGASLGTVSFHNQAVASEDLQMSSMYDGLRQTAHGNLDKEDNGSQPWLQKSDSNLQMEWSEDKQNSQSPVLQYPIGDEVLKKLDSLDRWMQRELVDTENSPLAASTNTSSCFDISIHEQSQDKTEDLSSITWQSPSTEELTPSFLPPLHFEIIEYSPTWSFSMEETKVLVTGQFLGDLHDFQKIHWCCKFGDIEVPAEIVQFGVLRCVSPKSAPGHVSFCITDGSKQACSDLKVFEFRTMPEKQMVTVSTTPQTFIEDFVLQVRFARLLLRVCGKDDIPGRGPSASSRVGELHGFMDDEWDTMETLSEKLLDPCEAKEKLLQMVFKQTLAQMASSKQKGKLWSSNKFGQGILHLAVCLGYEWALPIVKECGMSIDFRDRKGWTALHWAAHYGREAMVAALLAAGAKPGTVTDPTREHPSGRTAADIASSAGYEGIAGYLSACSLTGHLHSLTLSENEQDKKTAHEQGQRVVEYLRRSPSLRRTVSSVDDEKTLEESLSAVGTATMAAARIHAAFRESILKAQLEAFDEVDEYGLSQEEQRTLIAAQKIQKAYRKHHEKKIKESAALQIQQRFRGWKSRKDFLNLRQNVIRIQAYFRMHRAQKHYHKILWSVGVLEKALLRWKQKRKGLRGYQGETTSSSNDIKKEDFLLIGRKQADEVLDRSVILVQSMVRSRLARQQYKRMLEQVNEKLHMSRPSL